MTVGVFDREARSGISANRPSPAAGRPVRVLILEDNPSDVDLIVDALRQA